MHCRRRTPTITPTPTPGSLDALTGGKSDTTITGASGSLVCDVANSDASTETYHGGAKQSSLPRHTRTGLIKTLHNRAATLRTKRRQA